MSFYKILNVFKLFLALYYEGDWELLLIYVYSKMYRE